VYFCGTGLEDKLSPNTHELVHLDACAGFGYIMKKPGPISLYFAFGARKYIYQAGTRKSFFVPRRIILHTVISLITTELSFAVLWRVTEIPDSSTI
jgi:hypothetical protein